MAKFGYDHLHFRSEDPHAAKEFWEKMFAAKVIQERELGGAYQDSLPAFTNDPAQCAWLRGGARQHYAKLHRYETLERLFRTLLYT